MDPANSVALPKRSYVAFHVINYIVYMCSTVTLSILIPLMSAIRDDLGATSGDVAIAAAMFTTGLTLGKLIQGILSDRFGGRTAIMVGFAGMTAAVALFSSAQTIGVIGFAGGLLEFFSAVMWPALSIIIGNWLSSQPQDLETGFWVISLSSRISGALSIFAFSRLLTTMTWRTIAGLVTFFPLFGLAFTFVAVKDSPDEWTKYGAPVTLPSLREKGVIMGRSSRFWLATGMLIAFTIVRRFDSLLATLFKDSSGTSDADSGTLSASMSLGFIIGLLLLGPVLHTFSSPTKRTFVVALSIAALAVMCAIAIYVEADAPACDPLVLLGAFVLIAALIALQFYIFPSIFAVRFGLHRGIVGVVSAIQDALSYATTSLLYLGFGLLIDSPSLGWPSVLWSLAGVLLIGIFITYKFLGMVYDLDGTGVGMDGSKEGVDWDTHRETEHEEEEKLLGRSSTKAE